MDVLGITAKLLLDDNYPVLPVFRYILLFFLFFLSFFFF
jgi:hypothetical protein